MATMHCMLTLAIVLFYSIDLFQSQVAFESLCSTEVEAAGMTSIDGTDEFEIDLYESKFLSDDTVLRKITFVDLKSNHFAYLFVCRLSLFSID
jgi:hypothetical protein